MKALALVERNLQARRTGGVDQDGGLLHGQVADDSDATRHAWFADDSDGKPTEISYGSQGVVS
jgi:hypothetical protein